LIAGRAFRATRRRRVPHVLDLARADVGTTRKRCKSTCHSSCAPKSAVIEPPVPLPKELLQRRAASYPKAVAARGSDPFQQAGIDRPRARQTSPPSKTAGPKSKMTRRSSTDASAGGAVVAAQATRVVGWPPSQDTEVSRAEANRSLLRAPRGKPEVRSFRHRRSVSGTLNPGEPGSGDGVEHIDVHVKERFRRTISSR